MIKNVLLLNRKREELENKYSNIWKKIHCLEMFLKDYKNEFIDSDSKDALNNISIYLEKLRDEYKAIEHEISQIKSQIYHLCHHEILMKYEHCVSFYEYRCAICNEDLNELPQESTRYIFECNNDNKSICSKLLFNFLNENMNNENLLDELESYLEEFEDNEIVVRRNVYEKKRIN